MDAPNPRPLQTLAEFQQQHERLLDAHEAARADAEDGRTSDMPDARRERGILIDMLEPLRAFLRRGAEGGAYLFEAKERRSAQAMLDYWASLCYSANLDIARPLLLPHDMALLPRLDDAACPYVGLEAFDEDDARHFFGREERVEALTQRLQVHQLVVVTGASGSGKSSVVLAGLLPALHQGAITGSADWRYVPPFVPGSTPLDNLMQAVASQLCPDGIEKAAWTAAQVQRLRDEPAHLAALFALDARPAVFIVDQFEEAMTLRTEANAADFAAFVAAMESLLNVKEPMHRLLLTMRSDVDTQLAREYPELNRRYGGAAFPLSSMDSKQLREAIEAPARQVGLKFQDGVVDDLIRSVVGEDAGLPLLQFSLMALWERRHGNLVTLEALRVVDSPRQAMTVAAARLYAELSRDQQIASERIFLALSRQGDGATVFRNRMTRQQLHQVTESTLADRVIAKFERARLLRVTRRDPGDAAHDVVEVAHEALLRGWDLLQRLFAERRYDLERRAFLRKQALKWREAGFDAAFLLSGLALRQALDEIDRASMSALEQDFIDKSRVADEAADRQRAEEAERRLQLVRDEAEAERRINRRLRRTAVVAVGVLLMTATLALTGWLRAKQHSLQVLAQAEADGAKSLAERLAVEALTNVETNADLSLFYADEAVKRDPKLLARVMPAVLESLRNRRADVRLPPERIGAVEALALSPSGDRLLLANDKELSEWDAADGEATAPLRRLAWPADAGNVRYAVYVRGGREIALASSEGVWLWTQGGDARLHPLSTRLATKRLSVSGDGDLLAAVSDDETEVWVWSLSDQRQLLSYRADDGAGDLIWAGFAAKTNQLVVVVAPDFKEMRSRALVFDRRGGRFVTTPRAVLGTRCRPDSMAYAGSGSQVGLLQFPHLCAQDFSRLGAAGERPSTLMLDEFVDDIVFGGAQRQVVKVMRRSNSALVEDLDGGSTIRLQGAFDLPERTAYEPVLSISGQGERLATKGRDGAVRLFDLGADRRSLALRSGVVWTSPDDKLAVTRFNTAAGAIFEARDLASGIVLRRLGGGSDELADLHDFVLDADGRHLHALAHCGFPSKPGGEAKSCVVSQDLRPRQDKHDDHQQEYKRMIDSKDTLYLLLMGNGRQIYSASARAIVWREAQSAERRREAQAGDVPPPVIVLGHGGWFAVKDIAGDKLTVKLYALEGNKARLVRQIERSAGQRTDVSFAGQGRALRLSSTVRSELWDLRTPNDAPALVIEGGVSQLVVDAKSGVVALRHNTGEAWQLRELGSQRSLGEWPATFRFDSSAAAAAHAWSQVAGGWELRALANPDKVLLAGTGMPNDLQFSRAGTVVAMRLPREDRLLVYKIPGHEPSLEGRLGNLRNAHLTDGGRYLRDADGLLLPVDGAELLKRAAQSVQSGIGEAERCQRVHDKLACPSGIPR